jgi:sister chromatid cohesion protein PDS5
MSKHFRTAEVSLVDSWTQHRLVNFPLSVEGALGQLANILPDYILPFAVTVLSHSSLLESRSNIEDLQMAEKCLNFVLEPLIVNRDTFCFSLYKNMIEKMKNAKSAFQPLSDDVNEVSDRLLLGCQSLNFLSFVLQKIWTLCDLSLHLLLSKLKNVDMREYSLDQVNIPRMYFQEQSADFNNKRNYLTQEFKRLSAAASSEAETIAGPAPKRPNDATSSLDTSKRLKSA